MIMNLRGYRSPLFLVVDLVSPEPGGRWRVFLLEQQVQRAPSTPSMTNDLG